VYAQDGTADGVHSLLVRHTDAAGNASVATAFSFVLDTTAPALPVIGGLAADSDTGLVGDATTTRTTPTLTGTAEAGSVVTLYDSDGTTVLGTGTAGANAAWAVTSTALSLSDHSLTAWVTDVAGNLSDVSASLVVNIAAFDLPVVYVTGSQGSSQVKVSFYEGPVTYLKYEFLGSGGGEAVQATDDNDFVNLLGGDDAANGGAGDDVLDGGTGSNFLTGSAGRDVFFLDGRGGDTTWSTITDWTAGEQLAVWGWRPGVSKASWVGQAGAEGYQGVTMHADLDGNGVIDTSVTWAGHTRADLPTPTEQDGLLWFA
jgi:Ca2+-binding RTX toxin-like protein